MTGAAGFLGSHVVRRLLAEEVEVVACVRPTSDLWRLRDVVADLTLVARDLRESSRPPGRLDGVLHLAAAGVRPVDAARAVVEANVLGTLGALELARDAGARRFLYCGSCFEYGPGDGHAESQLPAPVSEYGAAKSAGWLLARAFGVAHGLEVVTVRPFTVYGPFEAAHRLVPSACLGVVRGEPIRLTGGRQTRDFLYVDDAVDGVLAAFRTDAAAGLTLNLCTGVGTAVRDVAERVVAIGGAPVEVRVGELPERAVEFATLSGDPSAAAAALGWRARTSLDTGLAHTLRWFEENAGLYVRDEPVGAAR